MAVKDYPIDFGSEERNKQIVYSPHDYGPLVYEQPWFEGGFTYESLYEDPGMTTGSTLKKRILHPSSSASGEASWTEAPTRSG